MILQCTWLYQRWNPIRCIPYWNISGLILWQLHRWNHQSAGNIPLKYPLKRFGLVNLTFDLTLTYKPVMCESESGFRAFWAGFGFGFGARKWESGFGFKKKRVNSDSYSNPDSRFLVTITPLFFLAAPCGLVGPAGFESGFGFKKKGVDSDSAAFGFEVPGFGSGFGFEMPEFAHHCYKLQYCLGD